MARQEMERNSLRMVGLALLNRIDQMGMMTNPGTVADPDGRLRSSSWRVRILGHLDEMPLWSEFNHDESWDNAANMPLIEKAPEVYRAFPGEEEGTTRLHVFVGSGTPFGGHEPREYVYELRKYISDGVSTTILAVVGGPETAEIWTKPGGLEFDPENPKAVLGTLPEEGFHVVLADSRVLTLKKDIPDELFKALVTHDGGERIDPEELKQYVLAETGEPDVAAAEDDATYAPPEDFAPSLDEPDVETDGEARLSPDDEAFTPAPEATPLGSDDQ